jgi:type II secretory pathway pseudopilin PulG
MAGYLDQYGAGDERRARRIKTVLLAVLAVVVVTLVGALVNFFFIPNAAERQTRTFFDLLAARQYEPAYALWGCTAAQPCPGYSFQDFLKDWGPEAVPPGQFQVLNGESCGSGTIVDVDAGKAGDKRLWVEKSTRILGSPPVDECPHRNHIYDFLRNLKYRLHGHAYRNGPQS